MMTWPKPVQKPHPPVHVGGAHPGGARRAVRYGDGWIPLGHPADGLDEGIPDFRRMAKQAGRDPASLEVSVYGITGEEKVVERYRAAGADRIVYALPPAAEEELLPILDQLAPVSRRAG